jgi:pSer/pThr/pTyr-binding forkhead associated (FHA) protein
MALRLICLDRSLEKCPGSLIAGGSYRVGRSSKCAFVLKEASVSRHHAELTISDNSICVRDLGSRNGTFVDGARVEEAEAKPGQTVRFGSAQFQVVTLDTPRGGDFEVSEASTAFLHQQARLHAAAVEQLSEAQRRVLEHLLDGLGEQEVAAKLNLSPFTVHNHVKAIYKKLDVNTRAELLAMFVAEEKKPRKASD